MKTISLRFTDKFAPDCGTIKAHEELINKNGFVWYGKLGNTLSDNTISIVLGNEQPKFLLIHSGQFDRYWVHVEKITKEVPPLEEIPEYYRDRAKEIKVWFKVTRFEEAPKNVISRCVVASSGVPLGQVSRHSMSPYYIIEYFDE